jgi:hypothetical protein
MRVLEYDGFAPGALAAAVAKVRTALERDDFRSAEVKKLAGGGALPLYRAKLNDADRLIFTTVRHGEATCALLLEVVVRHAYSKSRFLRRAALDEAMIPAAAPAEAAAAALPLRYLHPVRSRMQLLDKPISFDDAQQALYEQPPPLTLVGSAGSGKTALTLARMKQAAGEVLYVTRSAYLAQSASALYFALGFERADQEPSFYSLREYLESWQVPPGRELRYADFAGWFARHRQALRGAEPHALYEEFCGVLCAEPDGALARADYLALGVRQSLFGAAERPAVYDLFEKFLGWLPQAGLYEPSLIAREWRARVQPRYDFAVVDEVQDFTLAQLALVLAALRRPGQFVLCGDANQIVHPNFFGWSRVKSLFYADPQQAEGHRIGVLAANFRNSRRATAVANRLLALKQRRFGSIDRESNHLVQAVGAVEGSVELLRDAPEALRTLDERTRLSARTAVLVLRDEDKAAARASLRTPLVFSIHEAKGLEYDSVVLFRMVAAARADYAAVAEGVRPEELAANELAYRRAADKGDKSLDRYKFFVNALYVAVTRALTHVVWLEPDVDHPLLALLELGRAEAAPALAAQRSSIEDWQREAHRLEQQGKTEQAQAIRDTILRAAPVPWPVLDEKRLRELLDRVLRQRTPGDKPRQQLLEYAAGHDDRGLAAWLGWAAGYAPARRPADTAWRALGRKTLAPYAAGNFKEVLRQCDAHGVDHRTPLDLTPLMAAAAVGNVALLDALLARGAERELTDHNGRSALHWALAAAFADPQYARGPFAGVYERVAPVFTDLEADGRLVRLLPQQSEYLLWHTLITLFRARYGDTRWRGGGGFDSATLLAAWAALPPAVLRPARNSRTHLSQVLARNEVARDYAYNRKLFVRLARGLYQINPALKQRRTADGQSGWAPVLAALNLPLARATALPRYWPQIDALLAAAGGLPAAPAPGAAYYDGRRDRKAGHLELDNPLDPHWELYQPAPMAPPGLGSIAPTTDGCTAGTPVTGEDE